MVNDGDTAVNPGIGSSHFLINGVEPKDWGFVISNGPTTPFLVSLPPGRSILFSYAVGDRYFGKAGIYTVRWEGQHFRTRDLTFRVVPQL